MKNLRWLGRERQTPTRGGGERNTGDFHRVKFSQKNTQLKKERGQTEHANLNV